MNPFRNFYFFLLPTLNDVIDSMRLKTNLVLHLCEIEEDINRRKSFEDMGFYFPKTHLIENYSINSNEFNFDIPISSYLEFNKTEITLLNPFQVRYIEGVCMLSLLDLGGKFGKKSKIHPKDLLIPDCSFFPYHIAKDMNDFLA